MDIEPLSRHRLFCTGDAAEARVRMGVILRDHRLDPGDGVLDARCDYLGVGHIGLAHLQYGVEVRVRSEPTETFRLVQIPLAGWVRVRAGNSDIACDTTAASVPEPDAPLDMKSYDSSRYLLVVSTGTRSIPISNGSWGGRRGARQIPDAGQQARAGGEPALDRYPSPMRST